MNTYDFGYTTLSNIAEQISETKEHGPTQGFDDHTAEYFAASYAFNAIEGEKPVDGEIEAHLDTLVEEGAQFDYLGAVKIAKKF